MRYSSLSRLRDLLFLCALIVLLKEAFDRTKLFISNHKESVIHELDRSFIDQIYTAQRQLHFLEEYNVGEIIPAETIANLKKQIASIEEKYKKNSAGLALLGPIGSAAIIAKEEKLKAQLLIVINDIGQLLHTLNHREDVFSPSLTIDNGLEINKQLLRTLS